MKGFLRTAFTKGTFVGANHGLVRIHWQRGSAALAFLFHLEHKKPPFEPSLFEWTSGAENTIRDEGE